MTLLGSGTRINRVFIIAEAGVNHNGNTEIAKSLIDVAVEAEVDAIKFQTFKAEQLVSKIAPKGKYQKNEVNEQSQLELIKPLELEEKAHYELIDYCNARNIQFLSTAFDHESINFLERLNLPLYKIPSGEITNLPYLKHIGGLGKPIILSTGMANLGEIEQALHTLTEAGSRLEMITVLHCNTEYPTPMEDVNLKAMQSIENAFPGIKIGYSDHTLGIEVAIAAVSMGAVVIEKHFTIDKHMEGPDHKASLEPEELKALVLAIRNIEVALGDGKKGPSSSEIKNIAVARKSIIALTEIQCGETFTEKNLTVKRPGNGISPMRWSEILGKKATREFQADELIEF